MTNTKPHWGAHPFSRLAWLSLVGTLAFPLPAIAQLQRPAITPANDGTGTRVRLEGNRIDIEGGIRSRNGANLFHSFEEFGLNRSQIANFLSNPDIRNILGRVVGGNPSLINGLLQVTGGNSNLFLMNPAGIIFGPDARLNVPADFLATTANGIGFGDRWFSAVGDNAYADLTGDPAAFAFGMTEPGAIVNAGVLTVSEGHALSLLGGTVLNTGTLSAPGGRLTIAAIPGEQRVLVQQEGVLLGLEIEPLAGSAPHTLPYTPQTLPILLTGGNPTVATGTIVHADGTVDLVGAGTPIPTTPGTAIASGVLDVSGMVGGEVAVVGDRVGLLSSQVDASGIQEGGTVRIGGDYQGQGTLPNASTTVVNAAATLRADALERGNGGRVIVWADGTTRFSGTVSAQGGVQTGNGGFVEVSGLTHLDFRGQVNTSAPNGVPGTLLLDPTDITVVAGPGGFTDLTQVDQFADPNPIVGTAPAPSTIDAAILNTAIANVTLQATNTITFAAPVAIATPNVGLTAAANDTITVNASLTTTGGNIALLADQDNNGQGAVVINAPVTSNGGSILASGRSNQGGGGLPGIAVNNALNSGAGSITLTGTNSNGEDGIRVGSTITSTSGPISLTGSCLGTCGAAEGIILLGGRVTSATGDIALEGSSTTDGRTQADEGIQIIFNGAVQSTSGTITLTADLINLSEFGGGTISGGGNLLVQPATPTAAVTIGGTGFPFDTFLNGDEFSRLRDGFTSITIGRAAGSGATTLLGNLTLNDPLTVRSPAGNGSITAQGVNLLGDTRLTLEAGDSISLNNSRLTSNGVPLEVILNSDRDGNGTGSITAGGTQLLTNGGDLVLGGGTDPRLQAASGAPGGQGVLLDATVLDAGGGNVSIRGNGNNNQGIRLTSSQVITRGAGTVLLEGTSNGTGQFLDGILLSGNSRVSTTDGSLTLLGRSNAVGGNNDGVEINGFLVEATGAGAIRVEGTAVGNGEGVAIQSLRSNTGDILIRGLGTDDGAGRAGIRLVEVESTGGGDITLIGTYLTGSDAPGILALSPTSRVVSAGGNVTLTGLSGAAGNSPGVQIEGLLSSGSGNVEIVGDEINLAGATLEGTGSLLLRPLTVDQAIALGGPSDTGPATLDLLSSDLAALRDGFSAITVGSELGSGAMTLTGDVAFNAPVTLRSPLGGGRIDTQGFDLTSNTRLTLQAGDSIRLGPGTALTSNGGPMEVVLNADRDASGTGEIQIEGAEIRSSGGDLVLGGGTDPRTQPAFGGETGEGVAVSDGSILVTGGGDLSILGHGTESGTRIDEASIDTGGGRLTIRGSGDGADIDESTLTTGGGALSLTGTEDGLEIGESTLLTGGGEVSITGTGNDTGLWFEDLNLDAAGGNVAIAGSGNNGSGMVALRSTIVTSGTGTLQVTGTGDNTGSFGDGNGSGTFTDVDGIFLGENSVLQTQNGSITLTGRTNATGTNPSNSGVEMNNARLQATGTGTIQVTGTAIANGEGVAIDRIQTNTGAIQITGTGTNDPIQPAGVRLNQVESIGGGAITVEGTYGTGQDAPGILLPSAQARVSSSGGTVRLTGSSAATGNSPGIQSLGTISTGGTGAIALTSDEMDLAGGSLQGSGSLVLQPQTPAQAIALGGLADTGTGTLDLTTADLATLQNGFQSIQLGTAGGGSIQVVGPATVRDPLTLDTAGTITLTPNVLLTGEDNASLTFNAPTVLGGGVATANQPITFNGAVTVTQPVTVSAGNAPLTLRQTLDTGVNPVTLVGNDIDLSDRVSGTGTLELTPPDGGAIVLNGTADSSAATLDLTRSDLANLQNGFDRLLVGRPGTATLVLEQPLTLGDPTTFTASQITINGGITGIDNASLRFVGPTFLNGSLSTRTGDMDFTRNLTLGTAATLTTETGTLRFGGDVLAGIHNLTLAAAEIDLAPAQQVSGSGVLRLFPGQPNGDLTLGGRDDSSPAVLDLTAAELATLQDGFDTIVVGSPNGTGTLAIADNTSFSDPLRLQTGAPGSILINGTLTGRENASLLLNGPTDLRANVTTAGNAITFNGPVTVGENLTVRAGVGSLRFEERLAIGSRNLTLTADEIDLNAAVTGTGRLTLQAGRSATAIAVGGLELTPSLDLTRPELNRLQSSGLAALTIGQPDGGPITIFPSRFQLPTTFLASPGQITLRGGLILGEQATVDFGGNTPRTLLNEETVTAEDPLTFLGTIQLERDVTISTTSGNDITFRGAVSGEGALTITAGRRVNFDRAVTNLDRLTVNGSQTTFSNAVTINGDLSVSGAVTTSGERLTSQNGAIDLRGPLSSTGPVLLNARGDVRVGGPITGNGATLTSSGGAIALTGDLNAGTGAASLTAAEGIAFSTISATGRLTLNTAVGSITRNSDTPGNLLVTTPTTTERAISLNAGRDVQVGNVTAVGTTTTAGGAIAITAGRSIESGNITSRGTAGGNVTLLAPNSITTGAIDTSGLSQNGGDVFIDPLRVDLAWINAQGGANGRGGNVIVQSSGFLRVRDSFETAQGNFSIATSRGGTISLRHGGGSLGIPFSVGDAGSPGTGNGTAAGISDGVTPPLAPAPDPLRFNDSLILDNIEILTTAEAPNPTRNLTETRRNPTPTDNSTDDPATTNGSTPTFDSFSSGGGGVAIAYDDGEAVLSTVEANASTQFAESLGLSAADNFSPTSAAEALRRIEEQTDVKPAIVYLQFTPGGEQRLDSQLELLLVTSDGQVTRKIVPHASRTAVLATASRFRDAIANPLYRSTTRALMAPAQQLYTWFVAPLESELASRSIDNLVFITDAGLRTLPLAALHNGQTGQFLIERYSIGQMPSLSLTDLSYSNLRDRNVRLLAMGTSEFPDQSALPGVNLELPLIEDLWVGEGDRVLLGNEFTQDTLKLQPRFGIIHLATHASFQPGAPTNSYIQFADGRLRLDQLRQLVQDLEWNRPPIELLVLSACRTAFGDPDAELGFAGAALLSGVRSVVASLWSVNDVGTTGLMSEFYHQLGQVSTRAEALRQAQLAMLRGQIRLQANQLQWSSGTRALTPDLVELELGDRTFSHPYYWSAFILVGNPW